MSICDRPRNRKRIYGRMFAKAARQRLSFQYRCINCCRIAFHDCVSFPTIFF